MFTSRGQFWYWSVLRLSCVVAFASVVAFCAEPARETTPNQLKVTDVLQITHDGLSKAALVSDDSDLYVTESPASGHIVAKLSLRTAERLVLPAGFADAQVMDISADRTRLLVSHQGTTGESEFWSVPINAGPPQRLGDVTGRYATWSRDNKHLAFVKGSTIFLADADGTGAHELYTANGSVFALRFSPDGKRIRFSIGNTVQNTTEIWEIAVSGAHPHTLLENWQHASAACCGNWTANGAYYIFQVTQTSPSNLTTLWAVADHTQSAKAIPFQLTKGPISFGNALPARDEKKVWAFGVQPTGEAVRYDPGQKTFIPLLSGISATDLDYSPDGKWVAYISVPDGALWRCKADGTERLQLTSAPERAALPRWSPTGDRIAYVSFQPGKHSQIVVVSQTGGDAHAILPENRGQIDANWSSDGSRIMLGYLHDSQDLNFSVVDLNSHKAEMLPGSEQLFSPRWSPNGRYVAALSPDFTKVMLFDFKIQKWFVWLSEPAGAVSYPAWSADSKYLYFDDLVTEEESIRRIKIGENKAERVFKLEGIERYPGPFGLWSGRMPDGSYMFVRDRSTQEVYQLTLELP
jgi:dipeptidyl aminopeptidase/acylaminoacyl peptidase